MTAPPPSAASAAAAAVAGLPAVPTGRVITLEEGWEKIHKKGIAKLQHMIINGLRTESFTNTEYVDLYTTIYQMCIQKNPHCYTPQLYDRFSHSINTYLTTVALPAIQSQMGEYMIAEFVRRWDDHKLMKMWMVNFFKYLDRFYVKRHSKKPLQEVALGKFRTVIFDVVKSKATTAIGDLIIRDRQREEVDRDLLRNAIQIFVDMGMGHLKTYQADFEAPFISATQIYYAREAASWLAADSCPDYLRKAELRIAQERKRIKDYLHSSSEEKLLETLYQSLLLQHQNELLNKEHTGCRALLKVHAEGDLARMFSLYSAVPASLDPIAKMLKAHIQEVGNALIEKINAAQNDEPFIEELMKIHDQFHELVAGPFKSHAIFHKALKEAFENVVNVRTFKCTTAELLASYSDAVLKKGGLKLSEKALMTTLDNLVRLFTYLTDKDIFSEFYRKKLSARLLLQRSASTDAEKAMIGKLKMRCGAQYTSKFEGMINDMRTAADHHLAFRDWCRDTSVDHKLDFSVQTLTSGFWPSYPTDECKLPPVMGRCIDAFKMYYNTKTNNRKLRWIHNLGVVTMTAAFNKRKLDLVLSGCQATILMLFNEFTELTVDEIQKHSDMAPDALKRQLRSLASGKFKVLMKKPSDGYKGTDRVRVNLGFTSPQRSIRIPNASSKTTTKERKVAQTAVTEDRQYAIEANIVRIMKSRKTLTHQQLIAEVTTQLMTYFQPDPKQIKKRIEDLIARDYLERDSEKSNVYRYLA